MLNFANVGGLGPTDSAFCYNLFSVSLSKLIFPSD